MPSTPEPIRDLGLLLARADDLSPILQAGAGLAELGAGPPQGGLPPPDGDRARGEIAALSGDPNDLRQQGWGVVAVEGAAGDRLLAEIAPLVEHRRRQAQVVSFRVPRDVDPEEWLATRYEELPARERPRYVMLLGDLDEVPLSLQHWLVSEDVYVGRLTCPNADGYRAYASKIRASEEAAAAPAGGRALFCAARDESDAVILGRDALLRPCREIVAKRHAVDDVQAGTSGLLAALRDQAGAAERAVLLSVSHGVGQPAGGWASDEQRRALQGALLLDSGRDGGDRPELLTAGHVAAGTFLPGGVWLMFACFGAGTPARSTYRPWLAQLSAAGQGHFDPVLAALPQDGGRAFVAALPQAALASPTGPAAIVGHVDLAWTFSFREPAARAGKQGRAARYADVMTSLLLGRRVGPALRELQHQGGRLARALDDPFGAQGEARRAALRLQLHDLENFILLGDPAVRLSIGESGGDGQDTRGLL